MPGASVLATDHTCGRRETVEEHMRTARDRRRVWRAATRAAQEVRETRGVAGGRREREREKEKKWETGSKESNVLHLVFHFLSASTPAAAAAAAAAATAAVLTEFAEKAMVEPLISSLRRRHQTGASMHASPFSSRAASVTHHTAK